MVALRNWSRNYNHLSDLESFIQALLREEHSVHFLCVHRQELTNLWEAFRDSYEGQKYVRLHFIFSMCLIYWLIDSLKRLSSRLLNCPQSPSSMRHPSLAKFVDMFSTTYGTNPHIGNIEKMYYLLQKTEGEAKVIIRTCPMTNDGFDIW